MERKRTMRARRWSAIMRGMIRWSGVGAESEDSVETRERGVGNRLEENTEFEVAITE
jgi:hypothetical protein